MTNDHSDPPAPDEDLAELRQGTGGIGQQFASYELQIGVRFDNFAAQIDKMNRQLTGIHAKISCITLILVVAALAALAGALLVYSGWISIAPTVTSP